MGMRLISRIMTRLKGVARELNMYLGDMVRAIRWRLPGGEKHYRKNFDSIVHNHKWVFIVGCNNSGTSILQRIMKQMGNISTMKLEGQRYTRVFPRAMRRGKERVWMEYEDDLKIGLDTISDRAPRLVFDWLSHVNRPVHEYILEKTPANLLRMEWLDKAFPDCYFIGLVRNGYAVAEGIRRKSHKSIERAAKQWGRTNQALDTGKSRVKKYLELRYEDIVDDPNAAFEKIAEFLGVQSFRIDKAMDIDYGLKTVSEERITGLKNLNKHSIDRLTDQDIETINRYAEAMLKKHGYFRLPG